MMQQTVCVIRWLLSVSSLELVAAKAADNSIEVASNFFTIQPFFLREFLLIENKTFLAYKEHPAMILRWS